MTHPIKVTGFRFFQTIILYFAIIILINLNLSSIYAQDAANENATIVDIVRYMNSHSDLPEYCQCRLVEAAFREKFRNTENNKIDWPPQFASLSAKWRKPFASNWYHLHHYCWGIMRLNQAIRMTQKKDAKKKEGTLEWALGEFIYMEKRATPSFPLWPQLYMYKYQIYSQLGQPLLAHKSLKQAEEAQNKKIQ